MRNAFFLSCFLLLFTLQAVQSQSFYYQRVHRPHIFSGGVGISALYGDMFRPSIDRPLQIGGAASLGYLRRINRRMYIRAEANFYQLLGDDKESYFEPRKEFDPESDRRGRNLSFRSDNFEFSAVTIIDLLPTYGYTYRLNKRGKVQPAINSFFRPDFTPYIYFGLGLTTNNPKAELDGTRYNLRPLQTEGVQYGAVTITFPAGAGLRFKLGYRSDLALEGGYRFTLTDYLDDVSDEYIDPASFAGNNIAFRLQDRRPEIGLQPKWQRAANSGVTLRRGNPNDNDGFFIFQVKFQYYLSKGDLQRFTRPRPRNTFR
jgi:hypothetical protein